MPVTPEHFPVQNSVTKTFQNCLKAHILRCMHMHSKRVRVHSSPVTQQANAYFCFQENEATRGISIPSGWITFQIWEDTHVCVQNLRQGLATLLNTSNFVRNAPPHVVSSALFSVFGNVVKHSHPCLNHCLLNYHCLFLPLRNSKTKKIQLTPQMDARQWPWVVPRPYQIKLS